MTSTKALLAGLFVFASTAFAATSTGTRVEPSDLGLSLWVPSGWVLSNEGGLSDFRLYSMIDTTGAHAALFQFEVYSGVAASGSAKAWVKDEALVRSYILQGQCYGEVLTEDTMLVDGAYARKLYGRSADCDSASNQLLSSIKARYFRITGYGDFGWVMSFEVDTADLRSSSSEYLSILDSVKLDLGFSNIPPVGVKYRQTTPRLGVRRMGVDANGLRLELGSATIPDIEVADLRGRVLSGRIVSMGDGVWGWRSNGLSPGMVVVRVRSGSANWMDKAVLPR